MYTYLKKILFSLLIIMMPHINIASKAMDTEECDRPTASARKIRVIEKNQNDVTSFTQRSTSSQPINLEDSKISWTSYLIISPVKSMVQSAYNVLDYVTRNPGKAVIIVLSLACQSSAVAAQQIEGCFCFCKNNISGVEMYYGATSVNPNPIAPSTCDQLCPFIKGGQWVASKCVY